METNINIKVLQAPEEKAQEIINTLREYDNVLLVSSSGDRVVVFGDADGDYLMAVDPDYSEVYIQRHSIEGVQSLISEMVTIDSIVITPCKLTLEVNPI